ncbi:MULTISPECIES: MerR family transcriptional regulator [Saccharibacillus]|uniref:MerR family transcriptional regulator n=1 Tax=Saccharibacillus TaxID=456492 RepID=UPI00131328A6|nr:MerR family transcriptional regulator [Saccharibacillus sp. WB 17]MWJ31272.1 MerR family transcriptional regulator [Saccharibacillus sp. WB 17]
MIDAGKLTVSEMAKLCGISADTLRYYDKIGLFRPARIDPDNGYRYYSVMQSEVIGTVVELRHVGFSIEEIRQFMEGRNVEKSVELLQRAVSRIDARAAELRRISRTLNSRLSQLQAFRTDYADADVIVRELPRRRYTVLPGRVNLLDPEDILHGFIRMEKQLNESLPFLASNRSGVFLERQHVSDPPDRNVVARENVIFTLVEHGRARGKLPEFAAGRYACTRYSGDPFDGYMDGMRRLLAYIREHGLEIRGGVCCLIQIDISLTDLTEESVYEMQIRV